jgi:AcrR family transcriptional regulator
MLDENIVARLAADKIITETFRRLHPEKKNQVYRASVELFGTYGYDGLAVDRICRTAGISKGSFFQYFPSKSHLLEFAVLVFDDYLARWVSEVRQGESGVLARDRLRYLYEAVVVNARLHQSEKRFYLFVTDAASHAGITIEGVELERHFHQYVSDIIQRGAVTGEIRSDFDPDLTSYLVSILIEGLVGRQYGRSQIHLKQGGDYLISFLFDGISV